jgi:HEAT repeat protein
VYVGTQTSGVYKSTDAGQTWQPGSEGLGLAAGQMVKVTALRIDPQEPNVLYATLDYVVGSTQVHASAAGAFVTLDNGAFWVPLAGPAFPAARQASDLVLVPGKPLYARAVTDTGLETYAPDTAAALAALEGTDPQARATAARMLGLARYQKAGDALLAALDDPDPAVSMAAADALARLNDPDTASGLLVALEHPNEQVRLQAARALGRMRIEAAVEPLRLMLLNSEGAAAVVAADALGRIGSPAAMDAVLAALAAPDGTPRWHAALAALEAMGEPAVRPLTEMLASPDLYARRNAAEALGWIGSPSATAALTRVLDDASPLVREQAAWALGEAGDPAARRALERASSGDASAAVRAAADAALVRIGEKPVAGIRWLAAWAPALYRLQAVRWLILLLSLAGAAWLAIGQRRLSLRLAPQRHTRQ